MLLYAIIIFYAMLCYAMVFATYLMLQIWSHGTGKEKGVLPTDSGSGNGDGKERERERASGYKVCSL